MDSFIFLLKCWKPVGLLRWSWKCLVFSFVFHSTYSTYKFPSRLSVHLKWLNIVDWLILSLSKTGEQLKVDACCCAKHCWSLWHGTSNLWSLPRTCDIHNCCWAFGSGADTTCFNYFGLSRPGLEHLTFDTQTNAL